MLGRALGPELGAVCAEIHRAHGVDLRLSEGIAAVRGAGRVEAVVTTTGQTLACDLLVVGVGMRPADDWLRDSDVALDDGVLVDAFCETNVPGIFAAGDVARWPYHLTGARVRLEHEDNALRQGAVAARNMLGQRQAYAPVPYFWSDVYDLKLQYVGHATRWEQVVLRGRPPAAPFIAFYLHDGVLCAALAVNQVREVATLKKLIAARATPDPAALASEAVALKSLLPSAN
jgi:3-phenylpropionate/trans-cinnamate dioxygenase ferredoxin reductase subunit